MVPVSHRETGASPGYDPLAFALEEAHRRGLELHAWFNPFRAQASPKFPPAGSHAAARHPEWVRSHGGSRWFDPGEPAVRAHALAVIADVVRRYDIDGVHIDDYFYPYPPNNVSGLGASPFPDDGTFRRYGGGGDRAEWRRGNINEFVGSLYSTVKSVRRSVKVGISPFGIWQPGVPPGIEARLDAFNHLAADSRLWLRRGWCDYFSPQLYWRIDPPAQSFASLLRWWRSENASHRNVWPGIATDRVGAGGDGRSAEEMIRQIELARASHNGAGGHVHWSIKALRRDRGGVASLARRSCYTEKALVPAAPWLGDATPPVPVVTRSGNALRLEPSAQARWWVMQIRRQDRWSVEIVAPATAKTLTVPPGVERIALRAQASTGALSTPVLISLE